MIHHASFHLRYALCVDEVKRLRRQRAMKADNVGLREQGVQFDIFAAKLRKLRIVIKIIAEDFHSEAREKPGKDAPDLSSSNDADVFPWRSKPSSRSMENCHRERGCRRGEYGD